MILTNAQSARVNSLLESGSLYETKMPINAGTYNGDACFRRPLRASHLCKAAKSFMQRHTDGRSQARPSQS